MQRLLALSRLVFLNRVVFATALVILGFSGHAAGADDSKRHAAFRQGVSLMEAEKWDEALAIYRKLWDEEHTYDVALSLGQVELNLKAYRDAAEHLDFGVRNIPPREDAEMASRARRMLDIARNEVGSIEIRVDRKNADVRIDGKAIPLPLPPEVFLEPGPHMIEATSEGSTPIQQAIQATAGRKNTVNLAFGDPSGRTTPAPAATGANEPAPAKPAAPPSTDSGAGKDDSSLRTAILIGGLSVTAVAAAVTITFALQGSSASSDADDALSRATARFGLDPCSSNAGAASAECSELADAHDRRSSHNQAANVALFVAVVAGFGTATTFFLWPSNSERPERAIRLTPHIGQHAGGASLTGSF
jgi:hypothetical protein